MVHTPTDDPTLQVIFNLKRKLAEPEDGSDSDMSSIGQACTNRGRKLKRHARHVHRGRLAGEYGLTLDGAIVDYGGKLRTVIDQNPRRRRKNQTEAEEEGEEEEDIEQEPYDDDTWPYSQVNIKELLIPLSHPSELITHPALVRTFKNNKIHVLAEQALDSIRSEHEHMTRLRRLLSVLLGDEDLFSDPEDGYPPHNTPPHPGSEDSESDKDVDIMDLDEPVREHEPLTNGQVNGHSNEDEVKDMNEVEANGTAEPPNTEDVAPHLEEDTAEPMETDEPSAQASNEPTDPALARIEDRPSNGIDSEPTATATPSRSPTPPATRPTTRLQTAATTRTENPPEGNEHDFNWPSALQQHIRPVDLADFGLTQVEASEIRRMVQAALERSQEFLRCLEKVRLALDRADKQRKVVWTWCKDSAKLVAEQDREEE